jgi:hypothetical protein
MQVIPRSGSRGSQGGGSPSDVALWLRSGDFAGRPSGVI